MSITFASESHYKHPNPFWRQERRILPGGYSPVQTFPKGTKIYKGTWIAILTGLTCAVVKMAEVLSGGTTTKPRVAKDSNFVVGDVVMDLANTGKSPTITAIDTSNDDYDVLTLSAAITGLTSGHIIQEANKYGYIDAESTTTGALKIVASNPSDGEIALATVNANYLGEKTLAANDYVVLQQASAKYIPNAVLAEDVEVVDTRFTALAPAFSAVLLKSILPTFPASWLTEDGFTLAKNHQIIVIEQ